MSRIKPHTHEQHVYVGEKLARKNGHRNWLLDDDERLQQYYFEGLNHNKIAELLDRSPASVRKRVSRKGYTRSPRYQRFTTIEDMYIKRHYGIQTTIEIAETLQKTVGSIRDHAIKVLGLKRRYLGENSPSSTISDEDVELIRLLADEGLTGAEISRKMEVSKTHVYALINFTRRMNGLPDRIYDILEYQ
ncbi:hypothetical protein F9817_08565 [Vibrio sp. CAIM 722]|uniref:Uncharacterized protein n=1 Tax=Vibrio eleionomae TaxID=2653505 RepID=A0A7X4RU86_9VIBR|nr:hypothetical protein [Vibrio eleionomae]MZI93248.1 hypothetical protein [Vibrio eleionomae]